MRKMNRKCVLAVFLCAILILCNSVYVFADGSSEQSHPGSTVSSGDVIPGGSVSSGDVIPDKSVSSGDAHDLKYQVVDGGDNEIAGTLVVNSTVTDHGDEDANTFQLILEAWVTGSVVETYERATVEEEPVMVDSAVKTSSLLDGTTVLKNQISKYFDYYCGCEGEEHTCIEVFTSGWDGSGFQEVVKVYPAEGENTEQISVQINEDEKTLELSGFEYNRHPVVNGDSTGNGQKLIVKLSVETEVGFWGGNAVPLNEQVTAIYHDGQLQESFLVQTANVPMTVDIAAKDKTVYYGGSISGLDLIDSISAGYETAGTEEGKVTVNADGTCSPVQEWMDDYAVMHWDVRMDQQAVSVSNRATGRYELAANLVPAVEADSASMGAGAVIGPEGAAKSDEGFVYVMVPVVSFRNTTIYRGYIPDDNYFGTYNQVSVEWQEMNGFVAESAVDEDPYTHPMPEGNMPELYFTYIPENYDFSADTRVKVVVTSNIDNPAESLYISDAVVFGSLYSLLAEEDSNYAFTIGVEYKPAFEMPETGGPGTFGYTLMGMILMAGAALVLYKKKRNAGRGCALILAVVIAISVVTVPAVYAAVGVKTDRKCTVQVDLRNSGFSELTGSEALPIEVELYKVADIDISGDYTPTSDYSTLDFSIIDSETTREMWEILADNAVKIIKESNIEPSRTGINEYGEVTMDDLATGLYLVNVEPVMSDNYIYEFTPFLVSLPNNYYYSTGDDTWIYDLTGEHAISLKTARKERYGDIVINKILDTYNATIGGAAFVFQIEGVKTDADTQKAEVVYSDVVSMTFDGTGKDSLVIRRIPAGTEVTVTEVYSGASYQVTTDPVQTQRIVADDIVSYEFENTYDGRLNGGCGIVNAFTYDSESEGWIPSQTEDSTP